MISLNWQTLSGWVYADASMNHELDKAVARHISPVYVPANGGSAPAQAMACRVRNTLPGIYYSQSWFPGDTPAQAAKRISDYVQHAGILGVGEPVMLDLEQLAITWTKEFLEKYRTYLPARPTAVTVGPGQDTSVVPVSTLVANTMHLYVQLYKNVGGVDMVPATADEVIPAWNDLLNHGLPRTMLHPFYDGNRIPWDATDGCVFTLERMP